MHARQEENWTLFYALCWTNIEYLSSDLSPFCSEAFAFCQVRIHACIINLILREAFCDIHPLYLRLRSQAYYDSLHFYLILRDPDQIKDHSCQI